MEQDNKKTVLKADPEAVAAFRAMILEVSRGERKPPVAFDLANDDSCVEGDCGDVVFVEGTDAEEAVIAERRDTEEDGTTTAINED